MAGTNIAPGVIRRAGIGGGEVLTVAAQPETLPPDASLRLTSRAGIVTVDVRRGVDEHATVSLPASELRRIASLVLEGCDRDAITMLLRSADGPVKAGAYADGACMRTVAARADVAAAFAFGYSAALVELVRMTGGR